MDSYDEKAETPQDTKRDKPWGYERPIGEFRGIFLKELFIRKGAKSSLHYHELKDELFYLVRGKITVLVDEKEIQMKPGDSLRILPGQQHRFPIYSLGLTIG